MLITVRKFDSKKNLGFFIIDASKIEAITYNPKTPDFAGYVALQVHGENYVTGVDEFEVLVSNLSIAHVQDEDFQEEFLLRIKTMLNETAENVKNYVPEKSPQAKAMEELDALEAEAKNAN
jgi:hypothetical protein